MARFKDREIAIKLRTEGHSYSEIRRVINISKGTLSDWLSEIILSEKQLKRILIDTKEKRIETYLQTVRERKIIRERKYFEDTTKKLGLIGKRDFFIAGLFLYLGEGTKSGSSTICISNSDPSVIKFAVFWLTKILNVKRKNIKVFLHLYSNMKLSKEIEFWQKITGIPLSQFRKPYIKKSSSDRITHFSHGHGTCNILYGNVDLKQQIMAGIQVILGSAINGRVAQW